jgi:cell wall-associated NlpC family hydrolase
MRLKFYKRIVVVVAITFLSACGSIFQSSGPGDTNYSRLPDFSTEVSVGTEDVVEFAKKYIGVPYLWGGNSPSKGFDCSGLVVYVFHQARHKKLPRTSTEMARLGKSLGSKTPSPGDLVFFNTLGDDYSHVGIYVGSGKFISAPSTGGKVRIDDMRSHYWASRYTEARRVL